MMRSGRPQLSWCNSAQAMHFKPFIKEMISFNYCVYEIKFYALAWFQKDVYFNGKIGVNHCNNN